MPMCKDCTLYDLDAVKDKAGRIQKSWAGKCLWVSKEVWPVSVTYGTRVTAGHMEPTEMHQCQRFIKREDAK